MKQSFKNTNQNGKKPNMLPPEPIKISKIRIKMPLDPVNVENFW